MKTPSLKNNRSFMRLLLSIIIIALAEFLLIEFLAIFKLPEALDNVVVDSLSLIAILSPACLYVLQVPEDLVRLRG